MMMMMMNHPADASAPTLDKYVFGPLQFAPGCHFSPGTVGSLQRFTDLLPEFKGRRKEKWGGKHGWSNNGRRERDGGRKGRKSAYIPREVPANLSAVVAPTQVDLRHVGVTAAVARFSCLFGSRVAALYVSTINDSPDGGADVAEGLAWGGRWAVINGGMT